MATPPAPDEFPGTGTDKRQGRSYKSKVKKYQQRVAYARKFRDDEGYDKLWSRLNDLYRGRHFKMQNTSVEDRIAVNIALATINVIFPTVSVSHPKTIVLARDADDQDKAVVAEAILDSWWEKYGFMDEFRLATKDLLIKGHGWLKVGYRFVEEARERSPEDMMADFEQLKAQTTQYAPEGVPMPEDDEIAASVVDVDLVVTESRPFVERVSPHDMYVDPEATKLGDARWLAQRIIRPIEEVRKDERYDARARNNVRADKTLNEAWLPQHRKSYGDDIARATIWEFWDLAANTMCVFAEAGEGFLVKPRPMPYKFGHPFVMMRNYDVPDQFYPLGDLEAIEPLQHELNKTRSQLMNARKQYARKYLFIEDAFDDAAREALEDPTDGRFVPVRESADYRLNEVVLPLPVNNLPPDLFSYSQQIEADMQTVSGVTEYQRGGGPDIRRTATEAAIIQDSVNARSAEKLGIIERAIAEVSYRCICLARQFTTDPAVVRVTGRNGRAIWMPYQKEDFDPEYDYKVEAGSTTPKDENARKNEAMSLVQALGPLIGQAVDPGAVAMYILKAFGVKNPEQFLAQAPPMMPPGPGGLTEGPGMPPTAGPVNPVPGMMESLGMEPGGPQPADEMAGEGLGIGAGMATQLANQVGLNLT